MVCCFLEKTLKMSSFLINPDSDEFMWWLKWLAEDKNWSAVESRVTNRVS